MSFLSPDNFDTLLLFTLYHGLGVAVVTYLLRENRELKHELRENNRTIRDIAWVQEEVIRSDRQPAADLQLDTSALAEPKPMSFAETQLSPESWPVAG